MNYFPVKDVGEKSYQEKVSFHFTSSQGTPASTPSPTIDPTQNSIPTSSPPFHNHALPNTRLSTIQPTHLSFGHVPTSTTTPIGIPTPVTTLETSQPSQEDSQPIEDVQRQTKTKIFPTGKEQEAVGLTKKGKIFGFGMEDSCASTIGPPTTTKVSIELFEKEKQSQKKLKKRLHRVEKKLSETTKLVKTLMQQMNFTIPISTNVGVGNGGIGSTSGSNGEDEDKDEDEDDNDDDDDGNNDD
ncbi:hypothetical protein Cgig2_011145 [Carnegiea gigantea]|uniref:Uncharacterized protein n=1 Tax=Carnegiea gigantea TaxID=171969 RepID=A0A9Q1JI30_9CARY|nr:hypothetical protein Cgig2_011145 [Carnegiea gigantea]